MVRGWATTFVRMVDAFNHRVGRVAMYLLFVMMAILLWSSFSKAALLPSLWTLEMAQFTLTAYYLLGGATSLQLASHVRMDLLYGSWSDTGKAWADAFTIFALIFYLRVLLAEARKFWDEIAAEGETKAKIVQILKDYNAAMDKARRPYRYG